MRTLLHLSDLHFGAIDPPVAAALAAYLQTLPRDLLVVSGDFTQRATARQYAESLNYLHHLGGPQLYVPGNHDIPLYAFWERFTRPLGRYKKQVSTDLTPVFEDEELLVMGINTARPFVPVRDGFWKDGQISISQLGHVSQFARTSRPQTRVLVTHHPFIPAPRPADQPHRGNAGVVLGGTKALPMLAEAGIDLLLAGHLHATYHALIPVTGRDGMRRSILSVQAATATSHRRRHRPDGSEYANAFNLFRLWPGRLELEVHSYRHGAFSRETTHRYVRNEGLWAAASEASEKGGNHEAPMPEP